MAPGFYYLIQYVSNWSRMETTNVGVVLAVGEQVGVRVMNNFGKVRLRFQNSELDEASIALSVEAFVCRLRSLGRGELMRFATDALAQFSPGSGGNVILTQGRRILTHDFEADLRQLFGDLVEYERGQLV